MSTEALDDGLLWPDPQIGLNPAFEPGGTIDELVAEGLLHPECEPIFRVGKTAHDAVGRPMTLHRHQVDAIRAAARRPQLRADHRHRLGQEPRLHRPDRRPRPARPAPGDGVKAIVVYPMNALANSQVGELEKFLAPRLPRGSDRRSRFARYTGQESDEERAGDPRATRRTSCSPTT